MIYFAYGSNMNPGQMAERCPSYRTLGVARLPDYRLCFPRWSERRRCAAASIEGSAGDAVWGALYQLMPDDIPVLHHLEGYFPGGPAKLNRYVLKDVGVNLQGTPGITKAKTYVAVPDGTKALPSAEYLSAILEGARFHGLPKAYLAVLEGVRTG